MCKKGRLRSPCPCGGTFPQPHSLLTLQPSKTAAHQLLFSERAGHQILSAAPSSALHGVLKYNESTLTETPKGPVCGKPRADPCRPGVLKMGDIQAKA